MTNDLLLVLSCFDNTENDSSLFILHDSLRAEYFAICCYDVQQ